MPSTKTRAAVSQATPPDESFSAIRKLDRDLRAAAVKLTPDEARFLVDTYYAMQKNRIRSGNQVSALERVGEPHDIVSWLEANAAVLENNVKSALGVYAKANPLGEWALGVKGIGPVIAAGLLAHVDVTKASTAGAVWRFAGLDHTQDWPSQEDVRKWAKDQSADLQVLMQSACTKFGRRMDTLQRLATTDFRDPEKAKKLTRESIVAAIARRPWNGKLKVLCWKIGQSFVKVHNLPDAFYGRYYAERKGYRVARNERGEYEGEAFRTLAECPHHAQAKTYQEGRLPDGRIELQAERDAVKLFLAHYWQRGRELAGLPVPLPYPIARMDHAHVIPVPNGECEPRTKTEP